MAIEGKGLFKKDDTTDGKKADDTTPVDTGDGTGTGTGTKPKLTVADLFKRNLYATFPKANQHFLTEADSNDISKKIFDSKGSPYNPFGLGVFGMDDDEATVYAQFRRLRYKSQVSWLAKIFYDKYGIDLLTYLKSFLDAKEMSEVYKIVLNLNN